MEIKKDLQKAQNEFLFQDQAFKKEMNLDILVEANKKTKKQVQL